MATRAFCLCTGTCNTIPQGKGNIQNPIKEASLTANTHLPCSPCPCHLPESGLSHSGKPPLLSQRRACRAASGVSGARCSLHSMKSGKSDQHRPPNPGVSQYHEVSEGTQASCHVYLCHPARRLPSMFLVHCHLSSFDSLRTL